MPYLGDDGTTVVTTTDNSGTVSDLWSWVVQQQNQTRRADKFVVNDDGSTVKWQGQAQLLLPDADGKITQGSVLPETTYIMRLRSMSVKDRKVFQQQLKAAGYLGPDYAANGLLDVDQAFINAALLLARTVSSENYALVTDPNKAYIDRKPVSTDDYLKLMSGKQSGYSRTSVSKNITSFSDAESRGILESFYGDALGRRPTDEEVKKFKKAINVAAKANPDVTTTTAGTFGSSSVSKSGYSQADAQLKARNIAEKQVGAAGYISSTKYMDAFLNVLGGKIGRV